jgi:RNA polymerase sigma factor (sigma-70 family)
MQALEKSLEILVDNPKDASAWEALALNVYKSLLAYVASLILTFRVGPSETAEDIVQEAMFRFYNQWQQGRLKLDSGESVQRYLRSICRNLLIDKYRRERKATQLIDYLEFKFSSAFGQESEVFRSLFLKEVISRLSPDCAAIFTDYVEENVSLAELADRRGEEAGTFYTKWYTCLKSAKKIYSRKGFSVR